MSRIAEALKILFGRKHPYIGKIVLDIECDGCMAHIHKLIRVGEIIDIKKGSDLWPSSNVGRYRYAICRTIQSREDFPEETFHACIDSVDFQPIPSGNGFFWRR